MHMYMYITCRCSYMLYTCISKENGFKSLFSTYCGSAPVPTDNCDVINNYM